jgi:hypothetical protein
MTKSTATKTISLDGESGPLTVKRGGVRIEFGASGDDVTVETKGNVIVRAAANDGGQPAPKVEPKIGDERPDRTIFAGISPETGRAMYTTRVDAPLTMKWERARKYAAKLEAHGHKDWRLPSKAELDLLFNNRAAIGGFDTSGSYPAGHYWSSAEDSKYDAWLQRFSDGQWYYHDTKHLGLSVRCVRG